MLFITATIVLAGVITCRYFLKELKRDQAISKQNKIILDKLKTLDK